MDVSSSAAAITYIWDAAIYLAERSGFGVAIRFGLELVLLSGGVAYYELANLRGIASPRVSERVCGPDSLANFRNVYDDLKANFKGANCNNIDRCLALGLMVDHMLKCLFQRIWILKNCDRNPPAGRGPHEEDHLGATCMKIRNLCGTCARKARKCLQGIAPPALVCNIAHGACFGRGHIL